MNKEVLFDLLPFVLNRMATVEQYGWGGDFCKQEIIETNEQVRKTLKENGFILIV